MLAGDLCTGCAACEQICPQHCIEMKPDPFGFLYPTVKDSCIQCGLCEQSCPVLHPQATDSGTKGYAVYCKDPMLREKSSSGGVFIAIAKTVLDHGGVVCGAAYDDDFSVHHVILTSQDELPRLQGSKYAQSCASDCFGEIKDYLSQGVPVLFSGLSCQIEGLLAYLGRPYENLLTIDMVCHSVPSPEAWKRYVEYRAKKDADGHLPVSINMRSKTTGWSHYNYSVCFTYDNNHSYSALSQEDPYMRLFVQGYISRSACAACKFKGIHRRSDITLGDFWGCWDELPEMDDNGGTSLVLVHSEKGQEYLKRIEGQVAICEASELQYTRSNNAILSSAALFWKRDKALKAVCAGDYDAALKLIDQNRCSIQARILERLKGRKR